MDLVNLTVDVSAKILDINDRIRQSIYRVYLNSELMTERSWIWKDQLIFIKENIWVNIDNTDQHIINLEQIYSHKEPNILIEISQINILTHKFEVLNSDSKSITFRIV